MRDPAGPIVKRLKSVFALTACAALAAGCSSVDLSGDKIDYKAVKPQRGLDLPPDLTKLPSTDRYQVPGAVTASQTQAQSQAPTQPAGAVAGGTVASQATVAPTGKIAQIERAGNQRWLVVNMPPEKAYEVARDFWPSVGISLERDDPATGVMETVWAENRAKLPQDIIRRTIGRVFDSVYSTGEQDKYRTRVERTPKNTSEIYITHRGVIEVYTTSAKDSTIWQPRPSDPELEAEMLQRMLDRFERPERPTAVAAQQPVIAPVPAAVTTAEAARLVPRAGGGVERLEIDDPFDRAWRRVGLALDRGGFTVEDRERANGVYFVRFLDPEYEAKQRSQQGFFSKLFGQDAKVDAQQFRVKLADRGSRTDVTVQTRDGQPEPSATADKILSLLREQLR